MRIHTNLALVLLTLAAGLAAANGQGFGPGQAQQAPEKGMPPVVIFRGGENGKFIRGWNMFSRGWRPGWGMRMGGRLGPDSSLLRVVNNPTLRERVGITEEQASKIRQEITDREKEQVRSRAEIEVEGIELRNLLAAEKPDRAAIDAALGRISSLRLAQEKAAVHFRLDMREALTPAQRQKLMQLRGGFLGASPWIIMRSRPGSVPAPPTHPQDQ